MPSFLDFVAIAVDVEECSAATTMKKERREETARFVKGPIPAAWLEQAARLPGKALHAAMAIRYLDGFHGTGTVQMRPSTRNNYGMDRFSCNRVLDHLEAAGLIRVLRKAGAAPVVTVLAVSTRQNKPNQSMQ